MLLLPDEEMYEVRVRRAVRLLAKEQLVKVAMISWRVGRGSGGLWMPTAEDVPTLQSAIRTSKPLEIVVVAVNGGSAKLRTASAERNN
ncbi:hypothetical protein DIPPA_23809 [Diplonema papillatum]|nr:hypothetical protein DIPPA_23809 [Diplonema papillatum]